MFVFRPEVDTTSGVPDPVQPSSPADVFNTTLQAADETGLLGRERAFEAAADRRNDAIFQATGERLENPMRVYQPETPDGVTSAPRDPFAVDAWHAKLQDLAERYPQYRDVIRPDLTLAQDGAAEVQRATTAASDVWDRAPNSLGTYAAYAAASLASMAKDPLLYATGPLFPEGRALAGAAGVAWQAIKVGAANSALALAEQPYIQVWRKEAGLEYGIVSALEETAGAFLSGVVLDGAMRGGWRLFRRAQGRAPLLNDAGEVVGYQAPGAGGRSNPLDALEAAASSAPEGSLIRKAQAGDRDALATLAEKTGLHETPEVRAALEVLGREETERAPPAGVALDDHVQRFNDAMRAAEDPRALPAGDALIHATDVTAPPERIAEVMQEDPVALAAEIRETPEMLQEGLPWQDPQLRAAAHISRLSDGAFDMVAGGEVNPMLGAIVAEHVADPDLHAGLLRQLSEVNPKSPAEARSHLAELLAGPKDDVTHARVSGVPDELVDRPVTLVDDPYGRDASRQLEQLRQEHAAEIEAATGTKPAAEPGPSPRPASRSDVAATKQNEASAHTRLAEALDKAHGRLPGDVTVKSFGDIADLPEALRRDVLAARSAGSRPEGLTERQTGNIWIAADALDFDGTLSHETIHALRQLGYLTDNELQVLANKAAEFPDLFDRAQYETAYAGLNEKDFKDAMLQEAAAHLYEARENGANFGKDANAILRKIKQFLERARNKLKGLGFQNADDIMKSIDDGVIAARARRPVEMPGGGQVEGLPLFALRAFHSTDASFDQFDPAFTNEVGFHFGTKQQARDRAYIKARGNPFKYFRTRIIEADVDLKNPAVISRDIGRFDGETLAKQLIVDRIAPPTLFRDIMGADPAQQTRYVRNWLVAHGYDGVKYVNKFEGPGEISVMTLGTGNVRDANSGRVLFSLKAFHGTPHEVDRFSSEKIGTGEGAQAFGHGLYFAENEAVARQYRDNVGYKEIVRLFRDALPDDADFSEVMDVVNAGALPANMTRVLRALDDHDWLGFDYPSQAISAAFRDNLANWEPDPELAAAVNNFGNVYQVALDAEPEQLLDWDKPLGEQSSNVREVVKKVGRSFYSEELHRRQGRSIDETIEMGGIQPLVKDKKSVDALREAGIVGIRYLDGSSRRQGEGNYNYVIFDDSKIRITHVNGQPVSEPSHTGGALFSLRDDAREQLKADLDEAKNIADAKAKAQRERQALIDEGIRKRNERFVTTLRDARGQVDPAKALVYLLENHGQVDLPAGMTSVAAEQKAVEAMAKAGMEELLHTFRPQVVTGKTRQTARLTNVVRELSGEGTGDAAAKSLAQAWSRTHERLRQEFNAAGGDIPKLEGWFLPQAHDRAALLAAGKTKWVNDIFRRLDLDRIVDGETRAPLSKDEIRQALGDIWENITSDGHGTQAANAENPFGGVTGDNTGAKKIANQRQEHRFLHFKSADDWLDYQKQYGGGADPFRAMMQHVTSISKDIAAMRVLGTNPNRELARLAKFAMKQASLARPAKVIIDEAVAKVKDLSEQLLAAPSRLNEVTDRIGAIHKDIARIREKRIGPPSARNKKRIEALRAELFRLDGERIDLVNNGQYKVGGNAAAAIAADLSDAYDELANVQDVDKVLFPKKTEILGKTMTHGGFWTTAPQDYARAYINRAEAMWDLYRGATSAPVNVKAAEVMQGLRNLGVIGRGGSMVISSLADNFTQVMARRFTGLPAYKTMTDILKQLGPNAHREAQRQGLIGETYLHMFNDGARGAASLHGPEWSHYLAERTIALQGLGALTDAQRQAFGMSVQAAFADLAGKSFAEIGEMNPRLQKLLVRYGIDANDWDAIRLDAATGQPRDVDFLSPNLVRDDLEANDPTNAARRVAERYLGMILQETDFASPTAMLRARAAMIGKTRPGTLVGEFLRTGGQFKSFSFMYWMLHAERALREGIANGTMKGASYAAQVLLVTTLGGALVVQLKDLKGGKDPRPMDRPGFWAAAMTQGGGLGIWGDLLNSEQNRFGGGLVSTFGGPVMGEAEDVLGALGLSSKTKAGRGMARLLTGYVPGSSMWYLNLAWQRIAAESLQRQLDPTAYDAFRRRQASQMRDYGNGFWWAPGQTAPSRGPRITP